MEYLGVLAFVIVLCYMSKLIEELVGRDCKISSEKGINFEESFYQKKRATSNTEIRFLQHHFCLFKNNKTCFYFNYRIIWNKRWILENSISFKIKCDKRY